jgi:Ser/Thr protein kinase RdoA (MazF antagonist)
MATKGKTKPHAIRQFFSLTPERVLEAVERVGHATTGFVYALNSMENRVYDVELDDRVHVIAKFYRPGRWSQATILDEHRLLLALRDAEIPVCAPLAFPDGTTLKETPDQIWFALFPKAMGRAPDELSTGDLVQVGRLLGRIHNIAAALDLKHRPDISPLVYGEQALQAITAFWDSGQMPITPGLRTRYQDIVSQIVTLAKERFVGAPTFVIHGDCHRGNLLRGRDGFFFLDFDDAGRGPAVQDFWLLLPGRVPEHKAELDAFIAGYEEFRDLPRHTLRLVEVLRALRYIRYTAWVATRWEDPSFQRAFPDWGSERYWNEQLADLYEQHRLISEPTYVDAPQPWDE